MSTHNICFHGEIRKKCFPGVPSYQKLLVILNTQDTVTPYRETVTKFLLYLEIFSVKTNHLGANLIEIG